MPQPQGWTPGPAPTAAGWSIDTPPPPTASVPRDARGVPIVSSHGAADEPSALLQMLGPLAHPETLTDFARLLTLPVDSVRKALATAIAARIGPSVAGEGLSAAGRGLEAVGNSRAARAASAAGGAEAAWHMDPKGIAVAAIPPVLKFAGRGLQRAGAALSTPRVAAMEAGASEAAPVAASAPTTLREAVTAAEAKARPAPPPSAASTVAATPKVQLTATELLQAQKWAKAGMSEENIMKNILLSRQMTGKYHLPTPAEAARTVVDRNESGRWE